MRKKPDFDGLMSRVCGEWGMCGGMKNSCLFTVLDIMPSRGKVRAEQFAEWVQLAEGDNPNDEWQQKRKTWLKEAFVEFIGAEEVDAEVLRYSTDEEAIETGIERPTPKVLGVLETCIYVEDMERARKFYEGVMGFEAHWFDGTQTAYRLGDFNILLMFLRGASLKAVQLPTGAIPPHDGSGPAHFALAIRHEHFGKWRMRLEANGVTILSSMRSPHSLRDRSLYFRDPDGHLIELASRGLWGID